MFTGIVEEIGKIKNFSKDSNGATIEVICDKVLQDTNLGDSIAINGCCQTVTKLSSDSFCARVSDETLSVTTFKDFQKGDFVNLERALTLNTRLGGHIVTGHIDCVGKFISKTQLTDFYDLEFSVPSEQAKYVVKKGSVAINGISLTVAEIRNNIFKIAIIPHTFGNTNLKDLKTGDNVNLETDILGKYVEKFLSAKDNSEGISMKFLQENGYV